MDAPANLLDPPRSGVDANCDEEAVAMRASLNVDQVDGKPGA
jgi:hypothetical protein